MAWCFERGFLPGARITPLSLPPRAFLCRCASLCLFAALPPRWFPVTSTLSVPTRGTFYRHTPHRSGANLSADSNYMSDQSGIYMDVENLEDDGDIDLDNLVASGGFGMAAEGHATGGRPVHPGFGPGTIVGSTSTPQAATPTAKTSRGRRPDNVTLRKNSKIDFDGEVDGDATPRPKGAHGGSSTPRLVRSRARQVAVSPAPPPSTGAQRVRFVELILFCLRLMCRDSAQGVTFRNGNSAASSHSGDGGRGDTAPPSPQRAMVKFLSGARRGSSSIDIDRCRCVAVAARRPATTWRIVLPLVARFGAQPPLRLTQLLQTEQGTPFEALAWFALREPFAARARARWSNDGGQAPRPLCLVTPSGVRRKPRVLAL